MQHRRIGAHESAERDVGGQVGDYVSIFIYHLQYHSHILKRLFSGQSLHRCERSEELHLHVLLLRFGNLHAEAVLIYDLYGEVRSHRLFCGDNQISDIFILISISRLTRH